MFEFASIVTWSHVILFANHNDSMNLRSILRGFGWPRQDDGSAAGGQILLVYLQILLHYMSIHFLHFVLDPFTEFCFVHTGGWFWHRLSISFFATVPRQETKITSFSERDLSRFLSWWIKDGQHDQNYYGELSLTYQCQKIGSPSHHWCCFQVQSRNKATPNSFKIWRRTSCSMWSIDGEEQFMSGNSVGTVTWNLNFSVQRDIWDGHSFHQILLFLIFYFPRCDCGASCVLAPKHAMAFINCGTFKVRFILNLWHFYRDSTWWYI